MFFNYGPLKLNKKKWLRSPAKSYKGGYFFDKNNLPSPWITFLTNPYVFSLLLDPFFIQCKGPQCQLMWLVQFKEVVFTLCLYEDIICFIKKQLWHTSSAKSMNRELSFGVRAQFWCRRTKEFAIVVNRIFPALLAAWSRQQYLCPWVKFSFIVVISQSDKKEEYFQVYFDRSILYPDGVR